MPERPARVVLVGFMGSGKSSIGRLVARRLGYRFEDMDRRIEKRAGRPVAAIFRDSGEEAFRELERDCNRIGVNLKVDYRKGPAGRLKSKIEHVEQRLGRKLQT